MKVVTVQEMKQLEQRADAGGHTYAQMMQAAGRAVATAALAMLAGRAAPRVVALVGPGNNGGDGLVAARQLAADGVAVTALLLGRKPDDLQQHAQAAGVAIIDAGAEASATIHARLADADLVLDALVGTGRARPLEGTMRSCLESVRTLQAERARPAPPHLLLTDLSPMLTIDAQQQTRPPLLVLAVDCPSGLDCDTGALDPASVAADVTVTFAYPKTGHFQNPGAAAVGRLYVADIGIPPTLADAIATELAEAHSMAALLPARASQSHKGTFGKAMIVAGSLNYVGATYLAGSAATRVGAGLVTMAVARPLQVMLAPTLHEATWLLLPHDMGVIAPAAAGLLRERIAGYGALLVGCGLGTEKPTAEFLRDLCAPPAPRAGQRIGFAVPHTKLPADATAAAPALPPMVVDADGLNLLAEMDDWPQLLPRPTILTPHPGEMARLCRMETAAVQRERLQLARQKAHEWGHVVVLKGAHTICAAPDGRVVIQPFANPALATAGTGDVLAGSIVGLLAQGLAPFAAAVAGCYLHGLAGEWLRQDVGLAGGVASDLLPNLPRALRHLHRLTVPQETQKGEPAG